MTARHSTPQHPNGELPPTLVADRVGYRRGGRAVLEDVSVSAYPYQVLAITGPSGSGKSSLLALLAGLEPPDSGTVSRTGAQVEGTVPEGYGLVLQGYGLVSVLSAAENVEIVLQGSDSDGLDRNEILDRAEDALAVLGLDEVADHLVEQLSGGQQQRVAIARALVIEPAVLLADELTAELDHDSRQRVLDRVFALAASGSTVVICTHDPEVAARCHRQIELTNGRLTSSR
ncbi:MAG TPA: ATP-binding cassette domain-containing protein [Jatrophihabitans sp.]|jgi:ABC-type lipoprotein export system ATPase subunit|uniref:ABC transporter ATP-binding protein n=1 Tax=Jatrophihabitans sp. TaxID=1932789 RepID=UPI002F1BCB86